MTLVLFISSASARSVYEDYPGLSSSEIYRALNWIRDVSNPAHTAKPGIWTREGRVGDTLFIDGEIQKIQWSILRDGEYHGVKRIVLNSYGGHVEGAKELATVIREQGLTTVVPAGGVCMSACTLIFQAGVIRQAHTSAIFMYHSPRSGGIGMAIHKKVCREYGQEYCDQVMENFIRGARANTESFFAEYIGFGLNPELLQIILGLPEEAEGDWMKDGNWSKTVDLIFAADPNDLRIEEVGQAEVRPLEDLEYLNVVTQWFNLDPGWRTDRSIVPTRTMSTP